MAHGAESRVYDFGLPITPAQRTAIFAAARSRGLGIEDIRAMTPAGSISKLTRLQAREVLDRLNAGTPHAVQHRPRRPKGVYAFVTDAQRNKIESLRIELGWTRERLKQWLGGRTHADGRPMTSMDTTADASAVIELLKAVAGRTESARHKAASSIAGAGSEVHPVRPGE